MRFRQATKDDADNIAKLHTRSWQHAYRGMLNDEYLDKYLSAEKLHEWQQRLCHTKDERIWVLLAETSQQIYGFSCLFLDYGINGATYMDNLHVDPGFQSEGLGKTLLKKSLEFARQHRPSAGFFLWVFENNSKAVNFYLSQGGQIQFDEIQDAPGGGKIKALNIVW